MTGRDDASWRQAVNDALLAIESSASSWPTPAAAIAWLIDWHVWVALDPAVSSEAAALIERGRQQGIAEAELLRRHDAAREALRKRKADEEGAAQDYELCGPPRREWWQY